MYPSTRLHIPKHCNNDDNFTLLQCGYFFFTHCTKDFLFIYFLTPRSRVLLEKLTGFQLVKKFHVFYGTWRFITAFTTARHPSLSWASSIQSIPPHPTSWRYILILSFHLRLGHPSVSFLQVSPPNPCIRISSRPYTLHAPPLPRIYYWKNISQKDGPDRCKIRCLCAATSADRESCVDFENKG